MEIKKIKKVTSCYLIEFADGSKLKTYDDVILKNNLLYKKELNVQEYEKLLQDNSFGYIYNKVLKYISIRLRSQKEIDTYLDKLEVKDKEKIMELLIKKGFVNDQKFAAAYATDAFYLTNDGPYKIKEHLLTLGINEETALTSTSFNRQDIIAKLDKLIAKKVSHSHNCSPYMLKQKTISYFINLGYDKDIIIELLEKISFENDYLEKEYNKVKEKLEKKYSGHELYYKIKQKLYQKGYNNYDIEELIRRDF